MENFTPTSLDYSCKEMQKPGNECSCLPSSPTGRKIQDRGRTNPSEMCITGNNCDSNLLVQFEDTPDSNVNASMYDSFAFDESKYDSFEDSLDENAHVNPKKINASDFLSEQVNVTLRKVKDRPKLKGSYLCDSLEDICSLVSNVDHLSSSDELENINNILEKHGICEDSLRNRNPSLNDQNFDDDSLAILEAEKHFEDSLEDPDVASCVDSLMLLGSSVGDVDVTVDKIGTDYCGTRTTVEIIYENAPLSSDESFKTAENFISERNSPSLSDLPMSRDSLEEINDIPEMVLEKSITNIPMNANTIPNEVAKRENAFSSNIFSESLNSSEVTTSEFQSMTTDEFSNGESERASSVVNSCYFYDTFCINDSTDLPMGSAINAKYSCDLDNKELSIETFSKDSLSENLNEKPMSESFKKTNFESSSDMPIMNLDYKETVVEHDQNLKSVNEDKTDSKVESLSESLDLILPKSSILKTDCVSGKNGSYETFDLLAKTERNSVKPNSQVRESIHDDVLEVECKTTLDDDENSNLLPNSLHSKNQVKEVTPQLLDNQQSKLENNSHGKVSSLSIIEKENLNLNLHIELAINKTHGVNVVSIKSGDQEDCSKSQFLEKFPENYNESKIGVFNQKSLQLKNACAVSKTDDIVILVNQAHKKIPTLPAANISIPFNNPINTLSHKYNVLSPTKISHENLNFKLDVDFQLLKALDLHDSFYDFSERGRVQSRDSIMPLNLCIRDTQLDERSNELLEGKENKPFAVKSPKGSQRSNNMEVVSISRNKAFGNRDYRKAAKTPVTKIPVRKVESPFAIPVFQKQSKQDSKPSPCSEKPKKIPLVKSTSIDSIGKFSAETPKKHHFCTVRNSICRVPKSKEKPNPKKFQNIQSPVAMYIGNSSLPSPLKSTYRFDGNQVSVPSKTKGKSSSDVISPVKK